jgi:hypothetical protein
MQKQRKLLFLVIRRIADFVALLLLIAAIIIAARVI